MNKFLSVLALLAAFMFVGGTAQAAPAYPDQVTCEAAKFVWIADADPWCFDRVANNPESQVPETPAVPSPAPVPEVVPAVPAPVQEAVPAPVSVPEPLPTPTVERTELAYTGAEDVALATVGLVVGLGGVALVRHSLRMRRE